MAALAMLMPGKGGNVDFAALIGKVQSGGLAIGGVSGLMGMVGKLFGRQETVIVPSR